MVVVCGFACNYDDDDDDVKSHHHYLYIYISEFGAVVVCVENSISCLANICVCIDRFCDFLVVLNLSVKWFGYIFEAYI